MATLKTQTTGTRGASVLLLFGTVLFVVPSALHGNPPIESAQQTLEYVDDRSAWRLVHLVNILAVLIWACVFPVLAAAVAPAARQLARSLTVAFSASAAVYAVYFSLHAFGLPAAADQYFASGADQAAVLERVESLLIVLGSTAFTAQAMLGGSVALAGVVLARATGLPRWIGGGGIVAGTGWLAGALLVNFAVIVPFTVLAWVWTVVLAVALWRRG
jgi:hypothetical protein